MSEKLSELSEEELKVIDEIAKVPIETRRYIAKLEEELAKYKEHFEPQMIQIRLREQSERNQPRYYSLTGQPKSYNEQNQTL